MSSRTDPNFVDRLSRASTAKSSMLAKFKQAQDPDNPAAIENRKQRAAIAEARAERMQRVRLRGRSKNASWRGKPNWPHRPQRRRSALLPKRRHVMPPSKWNRRRR